MTRQVCLVRAEVEVPVAAQPEQDHARLAGLASLLGLVDHRADCVRGLGRRDDSSVRAKRSAASNVSFWRKARASIAPALTSPQSIGASPW